MFEVAPTVLFTVPRYLQKFAAQILVGIGNSSTLKRTSYALAMRLARRYARRLWDGANRRRWRRSIGSHTPWCSGRSSTSSASTNSNSSSAAARRCRRETMALWHMYGVNVVEIYGQTETAGGIIAGQRGPFPAPGNVGTAPAGWSVRLATMARFWCRAPISFSTAIGATPRRRGRSRATTAGCAPATSANGRGDTLRLVDRARDFIVTSGGKTLSPSFIENALRASPYIAEVAVFGHGRRYLSALVEIDFDTVADWARGNDVNYTGFTSLAQNPKVDDLIKGEIDKANCAAGARRAGQGVPHPAENARSRGGGRAGHADPQGQARADV